MVLLGVLELSRCVFTFLNPLFHYECELVLMTLQAADGSRQPTALELELATTHGESFGQAISKVNF